MRTPTKLASKAGTAPGGPPAKRSPFVRYGMLVCCIAMMLPIAGSLLSGGTVGGLLDTLALVVPLVACVGTHSRSPAGARRRGPVRRLARGTGCRICPS